MLRYGRHCPSASTLGDGRVSECVEQDACAKGVAV